MRQFAAVWLSAVVPRLVADPEGRLQALTLFEWLCQQHPGRFQPGQLRTLQRRVRAWRAQHGPDHEVYFEQVAIPGREAAFDFTDASDLGVTIRGVPIDYRQIIGSLVRKSGAFARYRYREELFPSLTFRAADDALGRTHGERADVEYVRVLHLAATTSERQVEATLRARLDAGAPCDYGSA